MYHYSKMAPKLSEIFKFYIEIETAIVNHLLQRFSPGQFAPALINAPKVENSNQRQSLKELLQNSLLWAVPKKRRSVEKVRQRKYGVKKYVWKPFVAKNNILTCNVCGGHHELDTLCGTCYKKVMDETKQMQETINEKLGISPIEEEVIVLYENEKDQNPEFWKGKRIIEMKKPRPSFFSKNLLQGSTQPNAKTSEVMEVIQPLEYK